MVNAEQKRRMTEFIADSLDGSGLYQIIERDNLHILVAEKPEVREQPKTIDVLAHNYHRTMPEFWRTIRGNRTQGIGTAHIFYKDGETFMVRLGVRGNIKDPRSLKCYTKQQIDAMIHLRDLEKAVLEMSGVVLPYYQHETERLEEGVRIFKMGEVALDYTHIRPGYSGYGFARDTISRDYRQAVQIGATITGQIELLVGANGYVGIAQMEPVKHVKVEQLRLV